MIVVPAVPLPPAEAARRAARGVGAFWLASPGADHDIDVVADFVGCDPLRVVQSPVVDELEIAWGDERRRWAGGSGAAPLGWPIGVGWLSYDLARAWIKLPARAADDHGWSALGFHFYDAVWRADAITGRATIAAVDAAAARRLSARLADGPSPPPSAGSPGAVLWPRLQADRPDQHYLGGVARILDYLQAGDAYQVNLARRLSAPLPIADTLAAAARLRGQAPAPHGLWLATADGRGAIVGNSPERFLRADGRGLVETRPIKGTRRRGADPRGDEEPRRQLVASEKDRAEHVMIVDLERNDLGRVCRAGSVVLGELLRVMTLPTVFHLVSTVRGQLRSDVGLAALLRATFPGGSVTGAPKQRAMEIIEELEPFRRGPYTGATGWLGAAGDLDLAVAIRTALVRDGRLTLSVGGGIVADSLPTAELAETTAKAAAFAALGDDDGERQGGDG
ncbi:MAG TPA: anthranilate synthase component I family protein [Polyangia bacterium]|nr:anthranilate synthase component I family protein [Polyangia bacterium]